MRVSKIVMNGYYGMGNSGDEAVLACALDGIRKARPDAVITVLSGDPKHTSSTYGVRSAGRKSIDAISAINSCDLYVSGGGSLLQDATSAASAVYYSALMFAAKLFGKRYAIYANGVGPLKRGWVRWLVRSAVQGASSVSVRDSGSMRLLERIGVIRDDIMLTADPVFSIVPADVPDVMHAIEDAAGAEAAQELKKAWGRLAIVSLRQWPGLDDGASALGGMLDILRRRGYVPIGLAFQPESDTMPLKLAAKASTQGMLVIPCNFHPSITAGIFRMAEVTVGMRLHSLIMSAAASVPALGISYDPKVDALFDMLPLGVSVKVEELMDRGEGELAALLDGLEGHSARLKATLPAVAARITGAIQHMITKAEEGR
ncbi:MAG TPA: polysaccharide pyruvyl transferase CsaB [Bacillota bacterium]|nr:polysaccharide pyruvyl transferase CsaB [Bacillota bacterium]